MTDLGHRPVLHRDVGIADADRLRLAVLGAPRPRKPALRAPSTAAVEERPLGVGIADVLHQNQLAAGSVGGEAAIGMLGELRPARPDGAQRLRRPGRIADVESEDLRLRGAGVRVGGQRRIGRKEQRAAREAGQRAGLAGPAELVEADLLPAAVRAGEQHPAAVVQRLGVGERLQAAGEDRLADPHQTGGPVAPHRPGAVVGGPVAVDVLFDLDHRPRGVRRCNGSQHQTQNDDRKSSHGRTVLKRRHTLHTLNAPALYPAAHTNQACHPAWVSRSQHSTWHSVCPAIESLGVWQIQSRRADIVRARWRNTGRAIYESDV